MPLYEYCCPKCELKFELLRPISQSDEEAPCPHCRGNASRILSRFASFSKDENGATTAIGGGSCSSCSATGCQSCNL